MAAKQKGRQKDDFVILCPFQHYFNGTVIVKGLCSNVLLKKKTCLQWIKTWDPEPLKSTVNQSVTRSYTQLKYMYSKVTDTMYVSVANKQEYLAFQ